MIICKRKGREVRLIVTEHLLLSFLSKFLFVIFILTPSNSQLLNWCHFCNIVENVQYFKSSASSFCLPIIMHYHESNPDPIDISASIVISSDLMHSIIKKNPEKGSELTKTSS